MRAGRALRKSTIAVMTAFSLICLIAGGADAASAVWAPIVDWGGTTATNNNDVSSIVCASPGNCLAVGQTIGTTTTALIVTESGGTWGSSTSIASLPSDAAGGGSAGSLLTSVACPTTTSCLAVGQYKLAAGGYNAMIVPVTLAGGTASTGTVIELPLPSGAKGLASGMQTAIFNGISCSAASCTVVGEYLSGSGVQTAMLASGPAGWSTATVAAPMTATDGIALNAVSCASGTCEAVGSYLDASGSLYPWAVQLTGAVAGAPQTVSMPAGFVPSAALGSSPGLTTDGLGTISCPSPGVCTAGGGYTTGAASGQALAPVVVPITGGSPGSPVPLSGRAITGGGQSAVTSIWCSDGADCTAVGLGGPYATYLPVTASESGGNWSSLDENVLVDPPDSLGDLSAITCTAPAVCVTAGLEAAQSPTGGNSSAFFASSLPALGAAATAVPQATVGTAYSATLTASGGSGSGTWAITSGTLPAGLTLNPATGVISGTPTAAGQSGAIATVSDSEPPAQTASTALSITVAPAAAKSPPAVVAVAFLNATGSKATVVLSCSGAPCAGAIAIGATEHLKGTEPTAVTAGAQRRPKHRKPKAGKPKQRQITLGSAHYAIAAGATQTITLTLNGPAAKLLKKLRKLAGSLTLTPTGATKPAVIYTLKFTAAKPKPKKPKPRPKR